MKVKVKYFALFKEIAGVQYEMVENLTDLDSLRQHIFQLHPSLKGRRMLIAVNDKLTTENQKLSEGDVVAIMPPFAGG